MKSKIKFKNRIIYKNEINNSYLNSENKKSLLNNYLKTYDAVFKNIDLKKNTFHILSKNFKLNCNLKDLKKFKKLKTVIVIGMGGSSLGVEAIYDFLKKKIKKKFIFLNNIDNQKIELIKRRGDLNKILFILISKSGNTIETLANISALGILKRKSKNIISISEKNNNQLYNAAKKNNIFHIEHKKYIGGRYSILSEVGMVPSYFMGVNFLKMRENINNNFNNNNKFLKESSIKLGNLLKNKKINSLIFLNYSPSMKSFLNWLQQLVAESLGKKGYGFLPVVSEAPKDHHSLLQLYLDGPKDKLIYIFSEKSEKNKNFSKSNFKFLRNKNLSQIKLAQKNALVGVLRKKGIPFREFIIPRLSESVLGEIFSYFILEVALVGMISNINPFNQPAVEEVKIRTKKILS